MNDVDPRARFPAQPREERDRLVLGAGGTGGEVGRVEALPAGSGLADPVGVLRVDEKDRAEPRDLRKRRAKILFGRVSELRNPGGDEEALETRDAPAVERSELREIARNDAAPEADVHERAPPRRGRFCPERGHRRRRRNAVERHVEDCCDATRRGGAGCRLEALPLRPPRLVDVDVRVHEAGHHDGVSVVDPVRSRARRARLDGHDDAAADDHRGRARSRRRDDPVASDDEVRVVQ